MSIIKENKAFSFREDPGDPWVGKFHHVDLFPAGDEDQLVKPEDLEGHTPGKDLDENLPWRLYYGTRVPGFPVHSHRGFETVSIVLDGWIDHFDSKGEHGRYAAGDVQWMTAGDGIRHTEMFPLVEESETNRMELFQLWLSLPSWNKRVPCDYKMLWREDIPVVEKDGATLTVIQGKFAGVEGPKATEASWASDPKSKMRIILIKLMPGASVEIDGVSDTLNRNLYLYEGPVALIDGDRVEGKRSLKLEGGSSFKIEALEDEIHLLLLEAEPMNEPIINDGPMIVNTMDEVLEGYRDYWDNQYGTWKWDANDPLHDKGTGRITSNGENPASKF